MLLRRAFLIASLCLPMIAQAQAWPSKPIRMIVPYGPGGGVDNFARPLAQQLSEQLGQQIVVDNRAGASGMIGSAIVAQAAPDGYTLLVNFGSLYLAPSLVKNPAYDPVKAFTPITKAATTPMIVVTHPSVPVKNMKELADYARNSTTGLNYVTSGVGTQQHLTGESLAAFTKTNMVHVAYKGGSQAMVDLLGGQVQMGILVMSTVLPQIQAGKLRGIAVIESQRSKLFPDIPTVAENGLPGFSMPDTFIAVFGPAGMAPALTNRIHAEVQKAMQSPSVLNILQSTGYSPVNITPAQFATETATVHSVFQKMVKDAGVVPN